ncbi:hypothetical protein pdam_00017742 [Pocillopora damicornis]|uniref:Cytosol aminopeptidase n=1 Tax=Pocillopora damicornis TaxID=46731 RepID=A0A3M6TIU3_POCDA|nr:hypothetical protein pdam_00017742 [Pocillopora damicornis]
MAAASLLFCRSSRHLSSRIREFCSKAVIDRGVVLGVFEVDSGHEKKSDEVDVENFFTEAAKNFNSRTSGKLTEMIKLSGFKGKIGKSKTYFGIDKDYPCVVVVGLGKKDIQSDSETSEEKESCSNYRQASGVGVKVLRDCGVQTAEVDTFSDPQAAAEGANLALFSYDTLKSSKKLEVDLQPHKHVTESDLKSQEEEINFYAWHKLWQDGLLLSGAQNFARELMETPSNLLTPTVFADTLINRFSDLESVQVLARDQNWAEEHKMGAFLSVGKGSSEPSVFLEMKYSGAKESDSPPLILVGKGVTFDSGGISIKPAAGMGLMKADMGGAATVSAAFEAIARLKVPINVTALVPLCENMPSGCANKPGDVITAMSAMDIALGQGATGVFTNSATLWHCIFQAGFDCGERMWRMPLYKHYTEQIQSDVADLRNTGKKRSAGSCTAAVFLKEFVDAKHWAHFDIAGVMDNSSNAIPYLNKGMSGRPTRALVEIARKLAVNNLD